MEKLPPHQVSQDLNVAGPQDASCSSDCEDKRAEATSA